MMVARKNVSKRKNVREQFDKAPSKSRSRAVAAKQPSERRAWAAANKREGGGKVIVPAETYRHSQQAKQRPDVGVQQQFTLKKPPRTYRYDSSLDPALSWDENRDRGLADWLLGLIAQASEKGEQAAFGTPQEWKGGGVRI